MNAGTRSYKITWKLSNSGRKSSMTAVLSDAEEREVTRAFERLLSAPSDETPERTSAVKAEADATSDARSDASSEETSEATSESNPPAAFEITLKPCREIFYSGADPATLLDDLRELGQIHVTAHAEEVPPLPLLSRNSAAGTPSRCISYALNPAVAGSTSTAARTSCDRRKV